MDQRMTGNMGGRTGAIRESRIKDRPAPKEDTVAGSPGVPSSVGEPTAEDSGGTGSAEEAAAPLTREAALEALAVRCKQALGFTIAQV